MAASAAMLGGPVSAQDKPALRDITYFTAFGTFGRDSYVYVAKELGYFADEGLNVNVLPGTGGLNTMKFVAAGRAQFGASDTQSMTVTLAAEDLPVRGVAIIHQKSPSALLSMKASGINSAKDLEGKSVGYQPGSTVERMFPLYARAAGIDAKKVTWVPSQAASLPQVLVTGATNAIEQYVFGLPLIQKAAGGREVSALPYVEYLPDLMGNLIVTQASLIKDDPELVKKFVRAILKGLHYAINNPKEAGEMLRKSQPTQDPVVAAGELTIMKKYSSPPDYRGRLGAINADRLKNEVDLLDQVGLLKTKPKVENMVVPGFESAF